MGEFEKLYREQVKEALILHRWSDELFKKGEYAQAIEKLEGAIPLLEKEGNTVHLARALTSLGRVFRVHGAHQRSLELYQRALKLHEQSGDQLAMVQSLNAVSAALQQLGRDSESVEYEERALSVAESTNSKPVIAEQQTRLGNTYARLGDHKRAVALLEKAVLEGGYRTAPALRHLAAVYWDSKQYVPAIKMLDDAIPLADKLSNETGRATP